MIETPDYIKNLVPYSPGNRFKNEPAVEKKLINLASNENPIGPSPEARDALNRMSVILSRYPDTVSQRLVSRISEKYNLPNNRIICGHGVESLLENIIHSFSGDNSEILTTEGTFIGIYVSTQKLRKKLIVVPLKNYGFDLDAIRAHISKETGIIYIANPNSPTGTFFPKGDFESFMSKVPDNVLVVLDEAYILYAANQEGYFTGLDFDHENLIVLRSFSKSHGLAGLRIGFGYVPEQLIPTLYKVKLPFEPNIVAQIAAEYAINDDRFVDQTIALNAEMLNLMIKAFDRMSITYVTPSANFVLILFPNKDAASNFCEACQEHGIIVRHVSSFGIDNGVRISTGTESETRYFLEVLEKVYPEVGVEKVE